MQGGRLCERSVSVSHSAGEAVFGEADAFAGENASKPPPSPDRTAASRTMPEAKHTTVLLETMSGKGSEVGATFEELAEIISRARDNAPERLGVCLDTCHVYSAGYDIVNRLDEVLEEFDKIIGLNRLQAIHLNDSMTEFNSHKDRHECLGKGSLGEDAIIRFVNHPALKGIPINLETPNELDGYAKEIELLRKHYQE